MFTLTCYHCEGGGGDCDMPWGDYGAALPPVHVRAGSRTHRQRQDCAFETLLRYEAYRCGVTETHT